MRSVSAHMAVSSACVVRYFNGMPVDPDVSPSLTRPCSAGVVVLNNPPRFAMASARRSTGISDQNLSIAPGDATSKAILSR